MKYNENGRRNQYDSYRDRGDNLKSKYQQPNHEYYKHFRNIGGFTVFNSNQHGKPDILGPKDVG